MNKNKQSEKQPNIIEKRNIYRDDDSGKIFLIALIAPFVLSLLFSLVASQIARGQDIKVETITSSIWYILAYSICSFAVYLGIYFFYNFANNISHKAISLKFTLSWKTVLIVILIGVISLLGVQYFIGSVDNLLKVIGYPVKSDLPSINPNSWGNYFLAIFFLALIPSICEELIFRGVILNGLRSRFNDIISVLLSALMFALMHSNLQQFVYPFILGSIMGWVALRTGSLFSSMLVHFINNFLVVTLTFITNMTGWSMALPGTWWFYLIAFALLGLTFGIFYLIDRFYFHHKSEIVRERTSTKTSLYIYISIAVSVILLIVMTILQITGQ